METFDFEVIVLGLHARGLVVIRTVGLPPDGGRRFGTACSSIGASEITITQSAGFVVVHDGSSATRCSGPYSGRWNFVRVQSYNLEWGC